MTADLYNRQLDNVIKRMNWITEKINLNCLKLWIL